MVLNNGNFKILDNNLEEGLQKYKSTCFMMLCFINMYYVEDFCLIAHFLMLVMILDVEKF